MDLKKLVNIGIYTLLVLLVVLVGLVYSSQKKVVSVKYNELFNGFQMKKELETKYTKVTEARKVVADSLKFGLELLGKRIESMSKGKERDAQIVEFNYRKEEFYSKMRSFEEDNKALASKMDGEIATQLNQYVKEYAEQKGIDLIVGGAENDYGVLYSGNGIDKTKEILEFVNSKFQGKK